MAFKYLILSSSGGGGHLSMAEGEKAALIKAGVSAEEIAIIDIMGVDSKIACNEGKAWIPNYGSIFSGKSNVDKWNLAQKRGGMAGVEELEGLIDLQHVAEAIQAGSIRKHLKQFLKDNPNVIEIIDTQALSTPVICRTVTEENALRKKAAREVSPDITVRKLICEFLTDKAVHYLGPIAAVKKEDAECLTVQIVEEPLTAGNETSEEFYRRKKVDHVKFSVKQPPIRTQFLNPDYSDKKEVYLETTQDASIKGALKERDYVRDILGADAVLDGKYFKIQKTEHDRFYTITLGSQSSSTILGYVDAFIEQVLDSDIKPPQRAMFFVTAGKNDGTLDTTYALARGHLEKRMLELHIAGIKWPESAKIVPLSFQDEKSMASLFHNSDALITRTGGISSIEADRTQHFNPTRKVYLHSEAFPSIAGVFPKEHFDACYKTLLPGTVRWEGGNAQYLMKSIDACLTSPDALQFNIKNDKTIPSFKDSLVGMISNSVFNKDNMSDIEKAFKMGSDPMLEAIGGLPVIAYAKDYDTVAACIKNGGQLTKQVQVYLFSNHVVTKKEIQALQKLYNKIQREIKHHKAPKDVRDAFFTAIESNNLDEVKGMLYRYPALLSAKNAQKQSVNDVVKNADHREIFDIIEQAKGATRLHLALQKELDISTLSHLAYLNLHELNTQYPAGSGKTPLTHCEDKDLRRIMVMLGAKPTYLNKTVSSTERKTLDKLYTNTEKAANTLKSVIRNAFAKSKGDETEFCTKIKLYLGVNGVHHPQEVLEKIAKSAFMEIKSAKNDDARMGIIERFVNFIRYLFGCDNTSKRLRQQSRKFLFHSPVEGRGSPNSLEDDYHSGASSAPDEGESDNDQRPSNTPSNM